MSREITIPARFRGPEGAGNGGYVAGLLARELEGEVEVSIRRPLPLEKPLSLRPENGDSIELFDGDVLLARATRSSGTVPVAPPRVSLARAQVASSRFPRFVDHPLPGCFVCGTERSEGDGLRIFPGPIAADGRLWAAPWTPDRGLADDRGRVRSEFAWAALDCAGAFAVNEPPRGLALLGRITARILAPFPAGEPVVVVAWPIVRDGRKLHPGTALLDPSGDVLAIARALWILTSQAAEARFDH